MLTRNDLLAIQRLLKPIEVRLGGIEMRLVRVETRLDKVEIRLTKLGKKIDLVERRLQKSINQVADYSWSLNGRVERIEKHVGFVAM